MSMKTKEIRQLIARDCPMCKRTAYMKITRSMAEEYLHYVAYGGLIQNELPSFNKFAREFVKTGYCPDCQKMLFNAELKDQSAFFYQDELRQEAMEDFMEQTQTMDYEEAICSHFAENLTENEKLLYLEEMELFENYFLDEAGAVKPRD